MFRFTGNFRNAGIIQNLHGRAVANFLPVLQHPDNFLSGVTSMSCGPWLFLPREVKMVLPLASRVQLCGAELNWYSAGKSVRQSNSQTVSPFRLTSRVRLSFSSVIRVLPFFNRMAAQGDLIG